jgi:hypothetical protein
MSKKITSQDIIDFIRNHHIHFSPTQNRLCVPIINRIYQKIMLQIRFAEIKICGELIIDGHHRYISSLMAGIAIETIPTIKTSATNIYIWSNIELDENEWDTPSKIHNLNKDDADFNQMDINLLTRITL